LYLRAWPSSELCPDEITAPKYVQNNIFLFHTNTLCDSRSSITLDYGHAMPFCERPPAKARPLRISIASAFIVRKDPRLSLALKHDKHQTIFANSAAFIGTNDFLAF